MIIQFKELRLHNFKNHRDLKVRLGPVTRITGQNGEGKSTIGEAVSWCLYGADPLGNNLIKDLSPEPRNYEYDRVEVGLLLSVDRKDILLERWIEGKETKYFINEVPAKATPYKEFVDSLFDKNLFLSLFSPGYFFSQKWEEQRGLLLKNVQNPTAKEVLEHLSNLAANKLGELLKKQSIEDLDAKHRDNRTRKDKELIAAKERTRTLQEQLDLAKPLTAEELIDLNKQFAAIDEKIMAQTDKQTVDLKNAELERRLVAERDAVKLRANALAENHKTLGGRIQTLIENPPEGECAQCGQPLKAEALSKANEAHQAEIARVTQERVDLASQYKEAVKRHEELTAQLSEIPLPDHDSDELRLLQDTRQQIVDQIKSSEGKDRLVQAVEEARSREKGIEASFKDSVFILDAVKSYLAEEAEIMAEKVQSLFKTLTLQLFTENKGDGERKPFFEIHSKRKPYRKLSRGEQYAAGMELIEVLSKEYNVVAPIFLDNAESFTGAVKVMGQAIVCRAVPGQAFTIESEVTSE